MENNGECSQQKCIQMTLDFPIISITHFDSNHKKGKNKSIDHNKETIPSNTINQLQQTTLNFPLIAGNTPKKHSFDEIDANNDTDDDEPNEHNDNLDEFNNDEYNELPLDGKPYMCPKEIKLCGHKYFSWLINQKYIN